jgi:hypothetical protein
MGSVADHVAVPAVTLVKVSVDSTDFGGVESVLYNKNQVSWAFDYDIETLCK